MCPPPVYKSFTEAMKDLKLPMDRAGESVVQSIKTMINTNSTPGEAVSEAWQKRKTQNNQIKLLHNGWLRDATKYSTDNNSVNIGYDNGSSNHEAHSGNNRMTNAGIAEVHNEGNSKGLYKIPARPFLFESNSWNEKHKIAIQNFIKQYYQSKGII